MPNTNSCCCGANPMSCCKMLYMFPLDDFFEVSAFAFLWLLFFLLRIFYFDLRCEHLLVCHANSSQNAWCRWLQLPDSIHFNTICSKPFPTGFPSETISLQISKTLFPCNSVISLNYESLQYIYIYTPFPLTIAVSNSLAKPSDKKETYIYIYIYLSIYLSLSLSLSPSPSPYVCVDLCIYPSISSTRFLNPILSHIARKIACAEKNHCRQPLSAAAGSVLLKASPTTQRHCETLYLDIYIYIYQEIKNLYKYINIYMYI